MHRKQKKVLWIQISKFLFSLVFLTSLFACSSPRENSNSTAQSTNKAILSHQRIIFGRVPSENAFTLAQRTFPMLHYLENKLGVPVHLQLAPSYKEILKKMDGKNYDFVQLGPDLYVRSRTHGKPYIAKLKPKRRGKTNYRGMIIALRNGPIKSLKDLKGRSFTFVTKESTSGYLFPLALMRGQGIDLSDFSHFGFSQSHDNVVLNVLKGRFAAGACYDDARKAALKRNQSLIHKLKIIARTDPIPNEPIAFSTVFMKEKPKLAKALEKALLEMADDPEGKEALIQLDGPAMNGFIPATDLEYEQIKKYVDRLTDSEENP